MIEIINNKPVVRVGMLNNTSLFMHCGQVYFATANFPNYRDRNVLNLNTGTIDELAADVLVHKLPDAKLIIG